jgi:hypothetical protein
MESEKKFRTKTGYCHILPDKMILSRDGTVGDLSKIVVGNKILRILIIYGLISAGLLYFSFSYFKKSDPVTGIIFLLIAAYLIYGIINSINNSATPIIERKSIQDVKFIKGTPGLTRARFEVIFLDNNGKTKRRLIMLPGSMTGGPSETELAFKIMTEEKLIK